MAETLRKKRSNQFLNSKNTKPELKVQRLLLEMGIFFNKHSKELAGTPDISIPSKKIILNVKGCFWHQHGCLNSKMPKTNQLFWHEKFEKIKINDIDQLLQNKTKGWTTFDLWECLIIDMEKIKLTDWFNQNSIFVELLKNKTLLNKKQFNILLSMSDDKPFATAVVIISFK